MPGRKLRCHVVENFRLTPTVLGLRFEPEKFFHYEPGQFISMVIPPYIGGPQAPIRRLYSLSSPAEMAKQSGYELCVKLQPHGLGSEYLKQLRPGDPFEIFAPFGDFKLDLNRDANGICFVSTGTGIAPFRSMVLSKHFEKMRPENVICVTGARTQHEIIYPGMFEALGIETVNAISAPIDHCPAFTGRVTDFLADKSVRRDWSRVQFFLCGAPEMIDDVKVLLRSRWGVQEKMIHSECFRPNSGTPMHSSPFAQRAKQASSF